MTYLSSTWDKETIIVITSPKDRLLRVQIGSQIRKLHLEFDAPSRVGLLLGIG